MQGICICTYPVLFVAANPDGDGAVCMLAAFNIRVWKLGDTNFVAAVVYVRHCVTDGVVLRDSFYKEGYISQFLSMRLTSSPLQRVWLLTRFFVGNIFQLPVVLDDGSPDNTVQILHSESIDIVI